MENTLELRITSTKDYTEVIEINPVKSNLVSIFTSLTSKGLNRMTDKQIEHIMCTSSLAAFN